MRTSECLAKLYFGIGCSSKEILNLLTNEQIIFNSRTLTRLCKKLCLFQRQTFFSPSLTLALCHTIHLACDEIKVKINARIYIIFIYFDRQTLL